jgi:hypothetical protein
MINHQASLHFADMKMAETMMCARWSMRAAEQYRGAFDVIMRSPTLVMGNTYDSITPLASARNVGELFEGIVFLRHDAYGVNK